MAKRDNTKIPPFTWEGRRLWKGSLACTTPRVSGSVWCRKHGEESVNQADVFDLIGMKEKDERVAAFKRLGMKVTDHLPALSTDECDCGCHKFC